MAAFVSGVTRLPSMATNDDNFSSISVAVSFWVLENNDFRKDIYPYSTYLLVILKVYASYFVEFPSGVQLGFLLMDGWTSLKQ